MFPAGLPLSELERRLEERLRTDYYLAAVAVAIDSRGRTSVPVASDRLASGDTLYVVARPDRFRKLEAAASQRPSTKGRDGGRWMWM